MLLNVQLDHLLLERVGTKMSVKRVLASASRVKAQLISAQAVHLALFLTLRRGNASKIAVKTTQEWTSMECVSTASLLAPHVKHRRITV